MTYEVRLINFTRAIIAAAVITVAGSSVASAAPIVRYQGTPTYPINPFVRYMHAPPRPPAPRYQITMADVMRAQAAGWHKVLGRAPFGANGAGTAMLMTDGTVL